MPTYHKADESVEQLAAKLLADFHGHSDIVMAKVKIDFLFAYGDRDGDGRLVGCALKKNGIPALGITRKIALKDRAAGRGDAEIVLDGDHWQEASAEEQAALLDHELFHLAVKTADTDDLGRPQLKLRKHDIEVGWFTAIAKLHGAASVEQRQAKVIMDNAGQYYWPDIAPTIEMTHDGKSTGPLPIGVLAKATAKLAKP